MTLWRLLLHCICRLECNYVLRHPCVAAMQNVFIQDGCLYIVMEYIPGGNLLSLVNANMQQGIPEDVAR